MDKTKKNNIPLLLSIISITICLVMLIGATIAWFTDTETNKGNTINAGTLDIVAQWYDVYDSTDSTSVSSNVEYTITGTEYKFTFEDTANNFADTDDSMISETNWQSGYVNAKLVEVINNGTLDVNIDLDAVVTDLGLEDALWYDFIAVDTTSTTTSTTGSFTVRAMSTLSDFVSSVPFSLAGKTDDTTSTLEFILIYGMLESAGNTYQTDMSEEIATSFTADIIVTATQTNTTEETVVYASTVDDITDLTADDINKTVILMDDITVDGDVKLDFNVNFDLNGYTLAADSFTMYTEDYCTVDIANGTIKTETIDVQIPNGSVNLDSVKGIITGEDGIVKLDATDSTLNLTGSTKFVDEEDEEVAITILPDTRVVVDTEGDVTLDIPDGTGIEVENADTNSGSINITGDGKYDVVVDGELLEVEYVEVTTADELTEALSGENKYINITVSSLTTKTWAFTDLTIPEGYTVRVNADASSFKITVSGDLTNNGTMINYPYESSCSVWWMTVSGSFINNGTLGDYPLCLTVENGTNNGTLELYQFTVTGTFTNNDDLVVYATLSGDDTEKVASTLNNNGTITFYSSTGFNARYITLNNYGEVHAESLAFITGHHYSGTTSAVGQINNYGTWFGTTVQGCGNCSGGTSSSDGHLLGCDHGITFTNIDGGTVVPN